MKGKSALLLVILMVTSLLPLTVTFVHLNYSFHRRSWEESRVEGQREVAHGNLEKAATFYQIALADASRFPIDPLMYATTRSEAADIYARLKKSADARDMYESALKTASLANEPGWLQLKFASLSGLGRLEYDENQLAIAETTLRSAVSAYTTLESQDARVVNNLIAGDQQIHNLLELAQIYSSRDDAANCSRFTLETQKLLTSFPLDSDGRSKLRELTSKYKRLPLEHDEASNL